MSATLLEAPSESGRMLVDPIDGYRYLDPEDLHGFPDELGGKPVTFELEEGRLSIKEDPDHEWTIEEMHELPTLFASGSIKYEIHRGRLLIMCLPAEKHSRSQVRIDAYLYFEGERKGHGTAYAEIGLALPGNVGSFRAPDAAFVAKRSHPVQLDKTGYLITPPELVVEVLSPGNTKAAIKAKLELYFEAGVQVVWIIDPKTKTVREHRSLLDSRTWQTEATLEIPDVIPGFRLRVGELFPE